jgi:hypothetical protein
MTAEATTLEYEQRVRPRHAVLAIAAGVLVVGAAAVQLSGPHTKVDELTLDLITAHKRFPLDVIGSVINACGLIAFALTVNFLAISTRARRPEAAPAARIAALVGGALAAVSGIAYAVVIAIKAHDFVTSGDQTYEQAHHLTKSIGVVALPFLGQLSALMLAMGVFFIALNAMRAGLLTRFMGYLGIFVGVLVIFPIGSPVPVVQGFWLIALGVLFAGRWPGAMPPAWSTGRAEPWPSSAQTREQRGGGGARGGRAGRGPAPATSPAVPVAPRTTRADTPKRKRKRRK